MDKCAGYCDDSTHIHRTNVDLIESVIYNIMFHFRQMSIYNINNSKIQIIITILKKIYQNEYNTDLHHCRIEEWINAMGDKQACIILLSL